MLLLFAVQVAHVAAKRVTEPLLCEKLYTAAMVPWLHASLHLQLPLP